MCVHTTAARRWVDRTRNTSVRHTLTTATQRPCQKHVLENSIYSTRPERHASARKMHSEHACEQGSRARQSMRTCTQQSDTHACSGGGNAERAAVVAAVVRTLQLLTKIWERSSSSPDAKSAMQACTGCKLAWAHMRKSNCASARTSLATVNVKTPPK